MSEFALLFGWLQIFSLLALLVSVVWRYTWWSLAHPAFWFASGWLAAVGAYFLMVALKVTDVFDEACWVQLSSYVSLTACFFLVAVAFDPNMDPTNQAATNLPGLKHPLSAATLTKLFSSISILAALVNWLVLGANIGGMEQRRQEWLETTPWITARMWYPYILCYPAATSVGWRLGRIWSGARWNSELPVIFMLAPLAAGLLWMLGTGGRQSLGIVLLYYSAGLGLHCIEHLSATKLKGLIAGGRRRTWLLVIAVSLVAAFSWVVSATGRIRGEYHGITSSRLDEFKVLRTFSQAFEYLAVPISGYQLKTNPAIRTSEMEWGERTFGVLNHVWIGSLLGWKGEDRVSRVERRSGIEGLVGPEAWYFFATTSAYSDIQGDFGFWGGLVTSVLLVVITQIAYRHWSRNHARVTQLSSAIPLLIMMMFWGYSNQMSILTHDVLKWMVVSFIAWDLARSFFGLRSVNQPTSQTPWTRNR